MRQVKEASRARGPCCGIELRYLGEAHGEEGMLHDFGGDTLDGVNRKHAVDECFRLVRQT